MLTRGEGILLVRKTREGVEAHLEGRKSYDPGPRDSSGLWKKQGVFVTLKEARNGRLRGCIGNPCPENPLIVEAIHSGILAATSDPRFNPIVLNELNEKICLELTVLSALEEVKERDPAKLKDVIRIGKDGVMVDGFGGRGLLLPQVAVEEEFDTEAFLTSCCLKAALPPDTWLSTNLKIYKFAGQIFSEDSPYTEAAEMRYSRH